MINQTMNLNNINNIFDELNVINNINRNYSLLVSPTSVEVRDKDTQSTIKKISNFFTDWWQGKKENVSALSSLTGRIAKTVKEQKINATKLSLEKVNAAVAGLKNYANRFQENTRERQYVQKAIKDLVYVSDQADRNRFLKGIFPGHVDSNTPAITNAVKQMVAQRSLTEKISVSGNDVPAAVTIPRQFSVDCDRFSRIAVNGEVVFRQPPKEVNQLSSLFQKAKEFFNPTPSVAKIGQTLNDKLGEKVFGRIGALQTQSLIADRVSNWLPNLVMNNFHMQQAGSYDYHVNTNGKDIKLDGKVIMKVFELEDASDPKTLGYVGVRRTVSMQADELHHDLEALESSQRLPGLQVRDVISPLSWTQDEARSAIEVM